MYKEKSKTKVNKMWALVSIVGLLLVILGIFSTHFEVTRLGIFLSFICYIRQSFKIMKIATAQPKK